MKRAFSPELAELNAFWAQPLTAGQRAFAADAFQATFIQFDEQGTEAAAVTGLAVVVTSMPPPPKEFRVDRPFLLILRDEQTRAVMFVARIGNPLNAGG
ncbi:MAG: serpin family protein [Longimicrobiales bacterium]